MKAVSMVAMALLLGGCAYTDAVRVTPETPNPAGVRVWGIKTILIRQGATVRLEQIPDLSREYAVRIGSIFAKNETTLKINPNGTLAEVSTKLDSVEALKAVNELIAKLPSLTSGQLPPPQVAGAAGVEVYEFVFGPDGKLELRPLLSTPALAGAATGTATGASAGTPEGGGISKED